MSNLIKSDLTTYQLSDEVRARLEMAQEALESFDDVKMPPVRFKDGAFMLEEGTPPLAELRGTIIFTHKTNVYFEKQWKPGQPVEPPRCYSPDGKFPQCESPIHKECRTCSKNQFGSSPTGDGKACRNLRPVFILLEGSIMPRQLRVPPTSLKLVEQYCLGTVADIGSYWCLETIIKGFKKSDDQSHWNQRFTRGERLTPERFQEVAAIRTLWMPMMKQTVVTAEDLYDAEATHSDPANAAGEVYDATADEVQF